MIRIELAGDPVGKGRPRFVRKTGRAYTPEKTMRYEDRMAYAAQEAMAGQAPLAGPLAVTYRAYMSVPASWSRKKKLAALLGILRPTSKPDWDNFAKVCDALNKIVWLDDSQVVDGHVHKWYSDRPRVEIIVVQT